MALNTRAPLVPCVIYGARSVHPYGKWSTRPGSVWVRVLPPRPTDQLTREGLREEADAIRTLYLKTLEEMAEAHG